MNPLLIVVGIACLIFTKDFQDFMKDSNDNLKEEKDKEEKNLKKALHSKAIFIKSKGEIVLRGQFPQERKDKPIEYAFGAKRFELDDLYVLKSYTEDGVTVYPIVELSGSLHPIYIDKKDYILLKEIQSFNS